MKFTNAIISSFLYEILIWFRNKVVGNTEPFYRILDKAISFRSVQNLLVFWVKVNKDWQFLRRISDISTHGVLAKCVLSCLQCLQNNKQKKTRTSGKVAWNLTTVFYGAVVGFHISILLSGRGNFLLVEKIRTWTIKPLKVKVSFILRKANNRSS